MTETGSRLASFRYVPPIALIRVRTNSMSNVHSLFRSLQLIEADEVKPGFRAFRIKAHFLEFRLANEHASVIDSNMGRNYVISAAGRYVVESGSGCRRVADAQIADCLRAVRPKDRFVELSFQSNPLWRRCYVSYATEGEANGKWRKLPMEHRGEAHGSWFQRIDAPKGLTCAFTDGAAEWDNNRDRNYEIRLPGSYVLGGGHLTYCGVSDLDVHLS